MESYSGAQMGEDLSCEKPPWKSILLSMVSYYTVSTVDMLRLLLIDLLQLIHC